MLLQSSHGSQLISAHGLIARFMPWKTASRTRSLAGLKIFLAAVGTHADRCKGAGYHSAVC